MCRGGIMSRVPTAVYLVLVFASVLFLAGLHAQDSVNGRLFQTATHRFQEVAPGVYFASGTGKIVTHSNSLVLVTSTDTIIVDSHVTPLAARALIASVKELTDKPVRFLVNTHYHFDHVHGNEGFPAGVSIIGHEGTRQYLLGEPLKDPIYLEAVSQMRSSVETIKGRLEKEPDPNAKKKFEGQLESAQAYLTSLVEARPVPPDITVDSRLTFYRDGRPIELLFMGRGHTESDLLVFLPKEKVLFTGDFLLANPSYAGDCYLDEWIETLEKVKKLDFDRVLPGHGAPFRDRAYMDAFQKVLQTLWDQLSDMRKKGVPPEEAIRKVDLSVPLAFYNAATIPKHMKELDPRIARRVYQRLAELEAHR
ncbi:MAG: MBL fold metallo-hydrolase [Acidobacteriota bacterium]